MDPCEPGIRGHVLLKKIPAWSEEDPRFLALCEHVQAHGVTHAVLMTSRHEVVDLDGLHRWRAAKQLQLSEIPVQIVPDDLVANTILAGLVLRPHYTKSARAYLAYPLFEHALEESRHRRLENLKQGKSPMISRMSGEPTIGKTAQDFASQLGFKRELFCQAKQVHEIFVRDAEYKKAMEPRILAEPIGGEHENSRPVGLGAVIAGWSGRAATNDKAKGASDQLELFSDAFTTLGKRFSYWESFSQAQKSRAVEVIRKTVSEMPEDLRAEVVKALKG
jgi:hypothetical protein